MESLRKSNLSSFPFLPLLIYIKHLLYLVYCSNHIWSNIRARKAHLETLREHSNIQGTRRALGYSEGTQVRGHLRYLISSALARHLDTWTLRGHAEGARAHLGHSDTQSTRTLGHLGTWGTLFSRLGIFRQNQGTTFNFQKRVGETSTHPLPLRP